MKYISLPALLFIILFSCQTSDTSVDLKKKFSPYLHGTWVTADYINEIVKTKSPLIASEKLTFISEFIFDTAGIRGDSIHMGAGLGNHEGADFIVYFKQGQTSTSLMTNIDGFDNESGSYELGYTIADADTFLILYEYDKNQELLNKTKYVRSASSRLADNPGDGLQYMVNKKLISGTYKVTDTSGKEAITEFFDNGKVSGFNNYKTYYVLTDFVASPEIVTDEICFEIQTKDQICYGFTIEGNTIKLFKTTANETDTLFQPGPPVYTFVKQQ